VQLERLLNLLENDPESFDKLVTIKNVETTELKIEEPVFSTFGTIDDGGGIIQN
jgi:hypothetical protein